MMAISAIDGVAKGAPILLFVVVLAVSYLSYHRIQGTKTPWY